MTRLMLSLAVIGLTLTTVAAPALAGQEVTYSANGTTLKGYIARPAKAEEMQAHGFTNPAATENGKKYNLPLAYNAEVDRQSWEEMRKLFGTALK
ncbi:MAG TPA: hypothetical protein DCQ64_06390 [Candidatus Rokubacteria bacterium]|nr:hypothetical protein [Candidatus Rokubacteria bacterium]